MARDPRWSLWVAILGSSIAFLDGTVVNVALPIMQRDLHATADSLQWIVEAYALFLASLVLVGGALGDRLGRRRMFSFGVAIFAVASMACGLAPTLATLVVARAIQGVGAALLVPGSLALISAAYPESERGGAIGTWSAFSAITAAVGPVAGGWVVTHASWRWLFFFNVPLAAIVLFLASTRVDESRDEEAPKQIDVLGATLATVGLGLVVYALVDAQRGGGLGASRVIVLLVFGIVTLVAFAIVEAKRRFPMVPLSLFRSRTFSGANVLTLLLYAALGGALYFLPFDLIQVQHYSPTEAGASLLPLIILISSMSPFVGKAAARIGPRPFLFVGPLVSAIGFVLLALPSMGGSYWRTYFPGVCALGLGMGLTVAPLTTAVMGAVERRHAGVASGINNAVSRAAALLAVAALGVVLVARFDRTLDRVLAVLSLPSEVLEVVHAQRGKLAAADLTAIAPPSREVVERTFELAFVSGRRAVMIVCALLAAFASIAGLTMIESRRER